MEGITSVGYRHAKRRYKEFKINILGDYHDLYVQSDTLLLRDVFKNFRDKCIEIYELDPCLKKTEVKLELLIDIDMLLVVEKGARGGICHSMHRHTE